MYLIKGKRNSEISESSSVGENVQNTSDGDSPKSTIDRLDSVDGRKNSNDSLKAGKDTNMTKEKDFDPDELPDGFCISPQRLVDNYKDTAHSAIRPAEVCGFVKAFVYAREMGLLGGRLEPGVDSHSF